MDEIDGKYNGLEDPGIRAFMIEGERLYPADAVNFTMAEQRDFYNRYCAHFRKARPADVTAKNFNVGDVPARLYVPKGREQAPVMLYLHGGGFVVGGLESHDDVCAEIASGAGIQVVAVEYRLAPEHPFPAAFDDCWAMLTHLAKTHADIIVGGDSAGGNLAAALTLKARDVGGPRLKGQLLIYPGLGGDVTKGSYISQANAPNLTTADVLYYHDTYKGDGSRYAEPLRETDYHGLPPAFVTTAQIDPLADDGAEWVKRLTAAGIAAHHRPEPLLVHAYLRARHMSEPAKLSFAAIVEAARSLANNGTLAV